ncbi:MAG: 50S ribosomal protein L20 [Phycisphaerales bacterium]|nr:50S ribosomal protein L20 [Phycisphaerales bacterium]
MPKVRFGAARHRKKVRIRRAAQGYRGGRSKLYRTSKEAILRAGVYAYRDRHARKAQFRLLWITRLTAACRQRGISYSRFISGLVQASVIINRKWLSEIAIHDPTAFDLIVEISKKHQRAAA